MNDKKPSKSQFYFSGVLEAFSMLKKMKKKYFASLDFRDNPIYPISNPDGQDREFKLFGAEMLTFHNYPNLL